MFHTATRTRTSGPRLAWIAALAIACGQGDDDSRSQAPPTPAPAQAAPAPAPAPAAPVASAASAAERTAMSIFSTRCAVCHGPQGRGDGPGSAGLEPKPRDYHDPAWQASVTDEHLAKIILYGGAAVGKSPLMPPNPDLVGKDDVVAALVAHIRSLRAP